MAVGFGSCDSFQDTIQATVDNAVDFARANIPVGQSRKRCLDCDEPIPAARRKALAGVKRCIGCQSKMDKTIGAGYNRRGSKDSQLR